MISKLKILILMLLPIFVYGQTFLYSYSDPCTGQLKFITYDMSAPIIVSYYGQTRAFTAVEMQSGAFDSWLASVYSSYVASPCQGVLAQQTATTSTNLTTNIVQNIMNLTTIASVSSVNLDIGGNVNDGSSSENNENKDGKNKSSGSQQGGSNNTSGSSNSGNSTNPNAGSGSQGSGGSTSGSGTTPGSGSQGSGGSTSGSGTTPGSGSSTGNSSGTNPGGGSGSSSGGSNGSGSGSGSGGGSGNGGGSGTGTDPGAEKGGAGSGTNQGGNVQNGGEESGTPSQEKIQEVKDDQNKATSQQASKTTSKARTNTQKPAILMTGDIVGLQQARDSSNDARATVSYTRVKGDGSASLGISADYMINSKISNVTLMRSWIKANDKGHKHINLISGGFSVQPGAWSSTGMYIRVNSLKRFTAIYGAAGSYGYLFKEPMISTLAIGGFMYKGIMAKKLEATIIMAGVYSPYTKYYTETWWINRPIVIPFFNFNYKITKTFGMGITGGGTYLAGQNVLNYQVLMGAKLIL